MIAMRKETTIKANNNSPAIRFAGFADPWERRKLGELSDITTGKLDANAMTPDGEYDFYTCSLQVYKIDKYAFEGPAITIAGNGYVGCLHLADGKFNAYQRTYVLSNFKAVREYLYAEIGNKLPSKVNQEARNGNIPYIVMDMLTDLVVSLPNAEEQCKLGNLFATLNRLITLHQQKYEKLVNLKKAMLVKMFPKNGELVPEVRFAGFSGNWERRRMGDIAEIVGGGTPSTMRPEYWNGNIDWYAPAEMEGVRYAKQSTRRITELGLHNSSARILPAEKTVLFTSRAGIGKMAILKRPGATNQGFQSMILKNGNSAYFIYSLRDIITAKAERIASGSTFLEISARMLANIEILVPGEQEQRAIGHLFEKVDDLIESFNRKIGLLQKLKSAFLEKMFV